RLAAALQGLRPRDLRDLLAQLHDAVRDRADAARADRHRRRGDLHGFRPARPGPHLQAAARHLRAFALLGLMAARGAAVLHPGDPDDLPAGAGARRAVLTAQAPWGAAPPSPEKRLPALGTAEPLTGLAIFGPAGSD